MQCSETLDLLSAYHDGELPADLIGPVEEHLRGCESCRRELRAFQRLSELATHLCTDEHPRTSWEDIEPQIADVSHRDTSLMTPPSRRLRRWPAVVAALAAAICLFAVWWNRPAHDHLAADFEEFLDVFDQDVDAAQNVLIANYHGQPTTIDEAQAVLQYRPLVAKGMPDGYALHAAYLFKMPCCTCMEAVYQREDGSCVCVFEHNEDQPIWFGSRPAVDAHCGGAQCRLVQVDGRLAVTFRRGRRFITLIGVQEVDEARRLVEALMAPEPA